MTHRPAIRTDPDGHDALAYALSTWLGVPVRAEGGCIVVVWPTGDWWLFPTKAEEMLETRQGMAA